MERKLFSLLAATLVFSAGVLAWNQPTRAALCSKCRDLMFVDSEGKCRDCGAPTASGALQLCPKCSAKRHQCEHCLAATTEKDEAAAQNQSAATATETPRGENARSDDAPGGEVKDKPPLVWTAPANTASPPRPDESSAAQPSGPDIGAPPPASAKLERPAPLEIRPESRPPAELPPDPATPVRLRPINPSKAGVYTSGKWRYQLQITSPGTQSEGRWGWLTYNGQKLPRGGVNDYYKTPWGPIYWVDVPTTAWGYHGWMPAPLPQERRQGRALALSPSLLAAAPTEPETAASRAAVAAALPGSRADRSPRAEAGNQPVAQRPVGPAAGRQCSRDSAAGQSGDGLSMAGRHHEQSGRAGDGAAAVFAPCTDRHGHGGHGHVHVYLPGRAAGKRLDPSVLRSSQ